MKFSFCCLFPVLAFPGLCARLQADVRLPAVLGSNMVIQRDCPARIWGWADEGEKVTVKVGNVAGGEATGRGARPWSVELPPFKAGPVPDIVVSGKNSLTLSNLLAGDVWVCSGQSNMVFALGKTSNGKSDVAGAADSGMRLFQVAESSPAPLEPQEECKGSWMECNPQTAEKFSGVAYFFGRHLRKELGVPIGLIQAAEGGTPAENWLPKAAVAGDDSFDPLDGYRAEYPVRYRVYQQYLEAWKKKAVAAATTGQKLNPEPQPPPDPAQVKGKFFTLYNGRIHPLTSQPIRGILWYQGESNAQRAFQYRQLLSKLIRGWRSAWGEGDLPFVIVQLANFDASYLTPDAWAELREAQSHVAEEVPGCALVVAVDTGGPKGDLHPPDKQRPGDRAALAALKLAYGRDVVASGPVCDGVEFAEGSVRIRFKNSGAGLVAAGTANPQGFFLAGDDRRFYEADAVIDGNTVEARCASVPKPVAVRYGWKDNPVCTLYNGDGLPAVPFRSDNWPGPTGQK